MTTDLVPLAPSTPGLPALNQTGLVDAWLAGKNPRTLRGYASDLNALAAYLGMPDAESAVELVIGLGQGGANGVTLAWRAALTDAGLSPATVARRLAALRSVVKVARMLGRVSWTLDVPSPKSVSYRDSRGPGMPAYRALVAALEIQEPGARVCRDRAILRLLFDRGLRRGEVVSLDVADLDLAAEPPTIALIGKGRTQREALTVNPETVAALRAWLTLRGSEPGPVFTRLDPGAGVLERIRGETIRRMLIALSTRANLDKPVRPHGLRHLSVTRLLDLTGGDLRAVAKFSRHRDIRVLTVYDDARLDVAGDLTRRLGAE